ncbi:MAG: hypothetical protein FJ249_04080 [Nitrospira sp.]|nr:hypothetical protein [Nitrospira sp.]
MLKRRFLLPQAGLWLLCLLVVSSVFAETLTITATGEYRLAEKDTPDEGKRRALQEATRLAVERIWAYLLGLPEVNALGIGQKDIQEYTRGLIELTEGPIQSRSDGAQGLVRVEVKAKIDTALLLRRINAVRQSQSVGD